MLEGLLLALTPYYLFLLIAGVLGGIIVGALPGLTATMATALMVPFTFALEPAAGLVILGAIYVGAMYADAIPAILINTPGTAAAVATAFDGYPLTKKGMAQHALIAACFASLVGATIGAAFLLLLAPPMAALSLRFGPPEYFWVTVFAITIIASIAGESFLKGVAGGVLGLLLSTVGVGVVGGATRFTFGIMPLQAGLQLIVALIGLFAFPQLIRMLEERFTRNVAGEYENVPHAARDTILTLIRRPLNLIRSSLIGVFIGILPGAGPPVASLVAYNEAKRWSKDSHEFGHGSLQGVAASETANNSSATASIIPLLALGIPGAPVAAVIYGVLLIHGLRPGAQLYATQGAIVHTFGWSLLLAGIVTFLLGTLLSRPLGRIVQIPNAVLVPIILLLAIVGSFALRNTMVDVYVLFGIGVGAYLLGKIGFHPGPIALGLILGPIVEGGLVTSLALSRAKGWYEVFFNRPLSQVLIAMTIASIVWTIYTRAADFRRRNNDAADDIVTEVRAAGGIDNG